MDENEFLSVRNLQVEYSSGNMQIKAVNNVSFDMKKGTTLGLVGETGAGKTTIAKSILRVLPDASTKFCRGEILFEGRDLLKLSEREMLHIRGQKISMISQDPMTALNPVKTIGDQIAEALLVHGDVKKKDAVAQTMELLKTVGITPERYNNYPFELSGGMKQRVIIAIALACNPELLLADEPTTALDVTIQAQVLDMIMELRERLKTSMILITHDLGIVAECCDNVAVVYAGQIVERGDKYSIFDHPAHPYTLGLFGSLPSMAGDNRRLNPIPGLPPDPSNLPAGCYFSPRCPLATQECLTAPVAERNVGPEHTCRCIKAGGEEIIG